MLNLDSYSYVAKFYYRETLSTIYNVFLFDLLEFVWIGETLSPIVKRQIGKPRKQKISYVGEFKN